MKRTKIFALVVLFVFSACAAVFAQSRNVARARQNTLPKFYEWWQSESPRKNETQYKLQALDYLKLKPFIAPLELPRDFRSKSYESLILHKNSRTTLVLVVPKESDQPATRNEEWQTAYERCAENRSLLVLLPQKIFSPINLNPHCSTSYGPDEVDFALYWLPEAGGTQIPHVAVTTNAPACVPSELYSFDRAKKKYVLAREKCGG